MDCGTQSVLDALKKWQAAGTITDVTGCWVTHYHDDHVDFMDQFQATYPCTTYADAIVADVVTAPQAYRYRAFRPRLLLRSADPRRHALAMA